MTDSPGVTIWVDADACPNLIREILFKAARRTGVALTLVANQYVQTPRDKNINAIQVPQGFDVADNEIVKRVNANDLVITGDIPLAAEVMEKGAQALNPRGEMYQPDTIRQKLNMRDFMDSMRSSGVQTGGPPPMNAGDRQHFANHLDKYLAKWAK
jgi:uncharacterized protein